MLNNIKIGPKLIGGFLTVAAVAALIGIMGISNASQLNAFVDKMYSGSMREISTVDDINRDVLYMARAYRNMVIFHDPADIASYDEVIKTSNARIPELIEKLENAVGGNELSAEIKEIRDAFKIYSEAGLAFAGLAKNTKFDIPEKLYNDLKTLRAKGDAIERAVGKAADVIDRNASSENVVANKMYANLRNMLIILLIAGVLFGIALGVYLANSISKPMTQLSAMLGEWSKGHLGMRINMQERTDEIGIAVRSGNQFADDLQNVIVKWLSMISVGDLSMDVAARNDRDEIGLAFVNLIKSLRLLIIDDGGRVLQSAAEKDLSHRLR
ncbi:MAG: MCP four helix bundle domain-containing protein, partial [Chitinispirillales bacterium]|nr:MCP four helix bundle domain-containing protein [Chitinispirillales bacterium]